MDLVAGGPDAHGSGTGRSRAAPGPSGDALADAGGPERCAPKLKAALRDDTATVAAVVRLSPRDRHTGERVRRPASTTATSAVRVSAAAQAVAGSGCSAAGPDTWAAATGRSRCDSRTRTTPIHTRHEPNMCSPTRISGVSVKYWT